MAAYPAGVADADVAVAVQASVAPGDLEDGAGQFELVLLGTGPDHDPRPAQRVHDRVADVAVATLLQDPDPVQRIDGRGDGDHVPIIRRTNTDLVDRHPLVRLVQVEALHVPAGGGEHVGDPGETARLVQELDPEAVGGGHALDHPGVAFPHRFDLRNRA